MKTTSEQLFEKFCHTRGFLCERIEEGESQTPDYRLEIEGLPLVAEVKQFEPTNEELAKLHALKEGETLVLDVTPGARVRKKITHAATQPRKHAQGKHPAIVVLYNNRPFVLGNPASDYEVRVGMYGFETIVLSRGKNFEAPELLERKFGHGRKLTENHNTTISAIAVLENRNEEIGLSVYHNAHAAIQLPPGLLSRFGVSEFKLSEQRRGVFQEWELIHAG